jgi:hypothetical protein
LSYSSRAGECRSNSSLSSKSEKGKVVAVASVNAQDLKDFNTLKVVEGLTQGACGKVLWMSQRNKSSVGLSLLFSAVQGKSGERRISSRGRESTT